MDWKILPNEGLGVLRFGATCSQARAILGNPISQDRNLGPVRPYVTRWEYRTPKIKLTFRCPLKNGNVNIHYLVLISTTSKRLSLYGESLIGQKAEFVSDLVASNSAGFGVENIDPILGTFVEFPDLNLTVYLSHGIVTNVQWTKPPA